MSHEYTARSETLLIYDEDFEIVLTAGGPVKRLSSIRDRLCIFCQSTKANSKEHWPPKWTERLGLRREGLSHSVSIGTSPIETGYMHQNGVKFKTLKVVCDRCNNGWMSALQNDLIKLHHKLEQHLKTSNSYFKVYASEGYALLKRYALMTSTVLERNDERTISIPLSASLAFYNERQLPIAHRVWVAAINQPDIGHNHMTKHMFGSSDKIIGYTFIAIGNLCFVVHTLTNDYFGDRFAPRGYEELSAGGVSNILIPVFATMFDADEAFRAFVGPRLAGGTYRRVDSVIDDLRSGRQRGYGSLFE